MVMMDDMVVVDDHLVVLFLFFSCAKAGTARPSETKAAKAIANFFVEFLLVVDQQQITCRNYRNSNEPTVNAAPTGQQRRSRCTPLVSRAL
jgi:hypothetical protein